MEALVPAYLLAGVAMSLVPFKPVYAGWIGWAFINGFYLLATFIQVGTFNGIGAQDWRGATERLAERLDAGPGAPLLFRSGFIEDNRRALGRDVPTVTYAPLRSAGQAARHWNVVALTATWDAVGRSEFFEQAVAPAIERHDVFYYFSDISGNDYENEVAHWIEERFEGHYQVEWLPLGRGLVAARYSARARQATDTE